MLGGVIMLINTRYSTIYNIQKSQAIKAISEDEENRNSGNSFVANFQNYEEKYSDSQDSIADKLITQDINSTIENIKFFSGGDETKIKLAIDQLYENDNIRSVIKSVNFVDISNEIDELGADEDQNSTSEDETFSERGIWYNSNNFDKSMAYREIIEDNVLESNVLELKNIKENNESKENFLSELEQERFGFNNRKVI